MSRRAKNMLLWSLIPVTLAVFIWIASQKTAVYYWTVPEALAKNPKGPIRISGFVVPGTIQYDAKNFLLNFRIEDEKTCEEIAVTFHGVTPDTFNNGIQVVVTGVLDAQTRTMNVDDGNMLVKCPSKYQPASGSAPTSSAPPSMRSPCDSKRAQKEPTST